MAISKSISLKVTALFLTTTGRFVQMKLQKEKTITGIKNDIDNTKNKWVEMEDKKRPRL